MPPTHKLAHGEKAFSLWSTEKGRDRANARRAIAGLDLAQQNVELLHELNAAVSHQNAILVDIATMLFEIRAQMQQPAGPPAASAASAPAAPPRPQQGPPPQQPPGPGPMRQPSAPMPTHQPSAAPFHQPSAQQPVHQQSAPWPHNPTAPPPGPR